MKTTLAVLISTLLAGHGSLLAADQDVVARLESRLELLRERATQTAIRITRDELKAADPQQLLALLSRYEQDREPMVRRGAYWYGVQLARLHPKTPVRQEVAKRLVAASLDKQFNFQGTVVTWLVSFHENDYDEVSKALLSNALAAERPTGGLIRVCGVANLRSEVARLGKIANDPNSVNVETYYYTTAWHARLALARMGVEPEIDACLRLVDSVNDTYIRVTHLLHDVAYIRQPQAIDYLATYLFSEKRLPPTNPGKLGEPYAAYVINLLAECLHGFPLARREQRGYTADEIRLCREWMAQQKQWDIIR